VLNLFRREKTEQGLQRTKQNWTQRIKRALVDVEKPPESFWEELEEVLIEADVGVATTDKLVARARRRVEQEGAHSADEVVAMLSEEMAPLLPKQGSDAVVGHPYVILMVGVNGVGKTTTIAKLANLYKQERRRVLLAAADTFRAAAIDQLRLWGERIGVEVIAHQPGADPGAVAFDAMQAARARSADIVIIDTAGRLHTKSNLMEELRKVHRVIKRVDETAPHEVLLVLDATTGQNGLLQAKAFTEAVGVTGIVLAKLDGTAKGGIVFAISESLHLPLRYITVGEKVDDLVPFEPEAFIQALFA
jgi:fused signal recognition particle receptor